MGGGGGGGSCSYITMIFCGEFPLFEKSFLSAMLMGKVSHTSLFLILFREGRIWFLLLITRT